MKGTIPKHIASHHLACRTCHDFREDVDIYYCEAGNAEFPGLCAQYTSKTPNSGFNDKPQLPEGERFRKYE